MLEDREYWMKKKSDKLRVCIVTTSFPRWVDDDQGVFVLEIARALTRQGVFIRVIGPHAPGAKTREDMFGIDVIRPRYAWPERFEVLRKYRAGLPVILRRSSAAWLLLPPLILSQFLAIWKHARDCDVIHTNWTISAFSAVVAKLFLNIPVVVTIQGSDIYETQRIWWLRNVTRVVLSRTDQVIALSQSLARLTESLGVPGEKIRVMPNGVNIDTFKLAGTKKEPVILFVGSIIRRKGVHHLIEAAPRILQSLPEYELVIIGDGPLEKELQVRVDALGLNDRIRFLGVRSPADVLLWMQKAKLFVLPSLEEGLGVVLLEALACGTPCVGSQVGGIPDVIRPEVGQLTPPGDPDQLADAIIGLLKDEARWEDMHQRAHDYVASRFSWQKITSDLLVLYRELMQEKDRPSTRPPEM
jgi:glycosyltransferase involved in cell wall biosynthesis